MNCLNNTIEYVVSGPSYMRFNSNSIDARAVDMINNMFLSMVQNKHGHTFSMLYNAFTEKNYGERLQAYRPSLDKIHADSGGLQIITRGLQNTDEVKLKVYENQGKYADVGMSFDEIPVKALGIKSSKTDTKNRYFDKENFEHYARQTGKNLKRQIESFAKMGTKCRPFAIIQGGDYDTYYRWAEVILDEVPKEMHDRIGGVAMGSAALGMGPLEDVKRAFYAKHLPFNTEGLHLHVLGVGSLKRLMPYLTFLQSGLYDGIKMSYDSTTHSMSLENGLFYRNGTSKQMGRPFSNIYIEAYEEIKSMYNMLATLEQFHECCNIALGKYVDRGGDFYIAFEVRLAFVLVNIANFMEDVERLVKSKDNLFAYYRKLGIENEMNMLYNVKKMDDFDYWERHVGKYLDSDPVQTQAPATLESLFE